MNINSINIGGVCMTIGKKILSIVSYVLTVCMIVFVVVFLIIFFQFKNQFEAENTSLKSSVLEETQNNYKGLSEKAIYEYTNLFIQEKNDRIHLLSDDLNDLTKSASNLYNNANSYKTGDNYNLMPGVKYSDIKDELSMIYPLETFLGFLDSSVFDNANIYYCSESGLFLDTDITSSDNKFNNLDIRQREWYQEAKNTNDIVWSYPYNDLITGKNIITCSKGVYDSSGKFLGAVGIDFEDLSFIQRSISGQGHLNNSSQKRFLNYLIIDKNGNVIMDSDSADTSSLSSNNDKNKKIIEACDLSQNSNEIYTKDVDDVAISYTNLGINDWVICFVSDQSIMNASISNIDNFISNFSKSINENLNNKIIIFIAISISVLAIMTVLSIYLSKKLTESITDSLDKLSYGIKHMGTNSFYQPIKIENNDEIAELAEIVNNVSASLYESINQIAIESARTQQELNRKEISNAIKSAIPEEVIKCPNIDVSAITKQSKNAGTNFYNYFFTDSAKLAFIIGEVSDSGVSAALFISYIKGMMESIAKSSSTPAEAMKKANKSILERNKENTFVKAVIGFLDLQNYKLSYCTAGYFSPIVKLDDTVRKLENIKTSALGVSKEPGYKTFCYNMVPGEVLVLYSSGLMSYNSLLGKNITEENIMNLVKRIQQASANELCSTILHDVSVTYKRNDDSNDITIATLRIKKNNFYRKILNNSDSLKNCLEELNSFINKNSVKRGYFVLLTIEEALTNIIKHGSKRQSFIELYLESFNDYSKIVIIDSSFPFNPDSLDNPDISLSAEKRKVGGLGIHLIKKISRKTEYKYEKGHNINTFII